jgi:hypothetical protein
MTETPYEQFLAGERPDDVLIYLHADGIGNVEALDAVSEEVGEGLALVLPGDQGRAAFQRATGLDPMDFAGVAMQTEGAIDHDCTDGDCPNQEAATHYVKFVFAFAEDQNEEVGGIYAEGDVIHAYAACNCGTTYSDKWVVGDD